MELLTKSREELWEYAKRLKLKLPKNIKDDNLRKAVETEAIKQSVELEEKVRLRLQEESRMKRELTEIRAEADVRGVVIKIPAEPTAIDILKLKKRLNMMIKELKPSPETRAIEASKKVYAVFHNREQEDMDVTFCPGGKYWFHLWPEKVHILPQWLIGWLRKTAIQPVYSKEAVLNPQAVKIGGTMEKSVRLKNKPRFLFEILNNEQGQPFKVPDNASFGVVLDEAILEEILPKQPVF